MSKKMNFFGMMLLALCLAGCTKSNEGNNSGNNNGGGTTTNKVRVTTYTPADITSTSASCGGDAIVEGNVVLYELGVCWGTSSNPTVSGNKQSTGSCGQPYVCTISNLSPGTSYHVRAFAYDGTNHYYGEDKSFTTASSGGGGGGGGGSTNYDEKILGGWSCDLNLSGNNFVYITYYFDRNQPGKLDYQYSINNEYGIHAKGTYTVSGTTITATYNNVSVHDVNWNPTTINGFTDGQSKTVTYTIQSCTDNMLVMIESIEGKTLTLERYN